MIVSGCVSIHFSAGDAPAEPFLEVSREGSRFSIDASGVSVAAVLTALGREAGFQVQDSRPDAERPPVDIALVDVTLQHTLTRLLDRQNHLIVYREAAEPKRESDAEAIDRIVLLGPSVESRATAESTGGSNAIGSSPLAGPVAAPPSQTAAQPPSAQEVEARAAELQAKLRDDLRAREAAAEAQPVPPPGPYPTDVSAAPVFTQEQIEAMYEGGLLRGSRGDAPIFDGDGDGEPDPMPSEVRFPIGQGTLQR